MKIAGIVFFLIGSMLFLNYNESETKNKIKKTEDLIRLLYLVKVNVLENKMVLKESFLHTKTIISDYIDTFLANHILNISEENIRKEITEEMHKYFIDCNAEILECVIRYIMILGTTDKETSVKNFNLTEKECENFIFEMKAEKKKNLRLFKTVTYGVMSAVVIILI